jgi:DNA-binding LacI/PurR family transcriptional regulator
MEPGGSGLIANGISRRLVEEGLSRSVVWCHAREDQVVPGPAVAQKMNLGALAIWPTLPTSPASEHRIRVLSRLMPIVLLDRRIVGLDLDFVGFDDRMAGKVLGRHLIEQGHRYFAFIGWSVPETVHHRLDGLLVALNEANLSLPPQAIFLSRNDGVASEWFAPLLALHPRPTAVVCANDLIAVALMQHLFELGLRVPQDIAVVGVGNTVGAMLDALGLTTIDLPHEDLGYAAADLLVSRLGGHDGHHAPPRERRVPVRLVVRRSCGTDTSRPT